MFEIRRDASRHLTTTKNWLAVSNQCAALQNGKMSLTEAQQSLLGKNVTATEWADAFNGGSLTVFWVLLDDMTYDGFAYRHGLNIQSEIHNRRRIFFCTRANIPSMCHRNNVVCKLDLCVNSQVYVIPSAESTANADRITLVSTHTLSDFFASLEATEKVQMVTSNSGLFEYLEPHAVTPETQLAAVRQHGSNLKYIPRGRRTDEVRLAAVSEDGHAVQYLERDERSDEMRLAAVAEDGHAIQHLEHDERTEEICLTAVQQDGNAIEWLQENERTDEVRLAAVTQNGLVIDYLNHDFTVEICVAAIRQNRGAAQYLSRVELDHPAVRSALEQS